MAGIVFYFEDNNVDVFSGRREDLDAWNYACKFAGDIDKVVIINESSGETTPFDVSLDTQIVAEMPKLEGSSVQLIPPGSATEIGQSLWDFDHKIDWYVFGPARGMAPEGDHIYIPQAGVGHMHSVHIASVVLAHRHAVVSGGE